MKIKLDTGVEITLSIDYSEKSSYCRSCKEKIHWSKTKNDKFMPINEDLKTSHYSTCPQAKGWRKK